MKLLKNHKLNDYIKYEKSGICMQSSTIGKTTLADLGSIRESRVILNPVNHTMQH